MNELQFDLPEEGSTSSVQLANALIDRITADDQVCFEVIFRLWATGEFLADTCLLEPLFFEHTSVSFSP